MRDQDKMTEKKEHILVCISPAPSNQKVISAAARMAEAFHAPLTAIYVRPTNDVDLPESDRQRLQNSIQYAQQCGVEDVAAAGVGLAFVVFPTAISTLPALNSLFGVLFFVSLFTAGITSLISIIQAVITGVQDKWELSHTKAVTVVLIPAFIVSFLFVTRAGLYFLDLADYVANNIGIVASGVIEVVLIGWFFKPEKIRAAANEYSNFSIGKWWTWCLKVVTVIVLGYTTISNLITYFKDGYDVYPLWIGVIFILFLVIGTFVLTLAKGKPSFYKKPDDAPGYDD